MTTDSIWTNAEGPVGGENNFTDGNPGITTAISFVPQVPGFVTKLRFYATTGAASDPGMTYRGLLWQVTGDDNSAPAGTLLGQTADVLGSSLTPGAWNLVPFASPIPVLANTLYRIGLHTLGRYCATGGYFTAADHTSAGGLLKAFHNGDNPTGIGTQRQGVFRLTTTATDYPSNVGAAASYWVDVLFDTAPATDRGAFLPFFG